MHCVGHQKILVPGSTAYTRPFQRGCVATQLGNRTDFLHSSDGFKMDKDGGLGKALYPDELLLLTVGLIPCFNTSAHVT